MNSYRQTLYSGIIRVAANAIMVAAVFVGMYQSARSAGASELVFCAWFFGITVPAWAGAFWLTRLVRRKYPAEFQSLVELPRLGQRLVSWHVGDAAANLALVRR
ncbi:hypothetical protein DDIC_04500 [Desulfovibrio desulfuricans]|uniref:Uncharacterized protein n=1 Tax=Desulfovibrio desulfuricans TaxID=876 RepID=A0A4P7UNJ6_DESDE|nr:hypothetical protein [Desulfovibrio desulfuricans]QCC85152.1 hypothetical protein DDIC_04500 [Desulfovibrio desulfuricans]